MGIRSLVLFSIVASAVSLATPARADVPNPTGSGGSTTTTSGAGGASKYDPNCSVASEVQSGSACQACDPTIGGCSGLGSDYSLVCQSSAKSAVYCNGPNRNTFQDQNVACSVSIPGGPWGGAALGGSLALAAALLVRRRRRG